MAKKIYFLLICLGTLGFSSLMFSNTSKGFPEDSIGSKAKKFLSKDLETIQKMIKSCNSAVLEKYDLPTLDLVRNDEDWLKYSNEGHNPFYIHADFNGDGKQDHVFLANKKTANGYAVFVVLSTNKGQELQKILEWNGSTALGQGLAIAKPGTYKTAAGKGYWEPAPGEPEKVDLKLPGIDFFKFESADSVFYWDTKKKAFASVAMSD